MVDELTTLVAALLAFGGLFRGLLFSRIQLPIAVGVEFLQYRLLSRATRAAALGAIGGRFPGGFLLGGVELAIAIPVKVLEQFLPRDRVEVLALARFGGRGASRLHFLGIETTVPIGIESFDQLSL
jgi:hypothetical protein